MIKLLFLILITIFLPPLGVFLLTGCSADLLINILLTLLGFIPGHLHAFYLEYVYVKRRDERKQGIVDTTRAPGVFSERVQSGGHGRVGVPAQGGVPAQQGYVGGEGQQAPVVQGQQGYGTVH